MQQNTLQNILHVKSYMKRNNICCNRFEADVSMLAMMTVDMYNDRLGAEEANLDTFLNFVI